MLNRNTLPLAGAAGAGATLMYFLDRARGARRRSLVEDQLIHAGHRLADGLGKTGRDLRNHARGVSAAARRRLIADQADDRIIVERVRARLGRVASHPGSIKVGAAAGRITLTGPVLAKEVDRIVAAVASVRGVHEVEDRLERYDTAGNVPGLQGNARMREPRFELLQENWTPAARFLTTVGGGVLALYGFTTRRHGPVDTALGLAGLVLFARGATNKPTRELVGLGAGRGAVTVQKTINIHAPIQEVFAHFTDWERWPQWMSHVREVRVSGERGATGERTHWVVDAVAGTTVQWDAVVTELEPDQLVSWKSIEGSAIEHAGTIRFDINPDGSTRVHIRMSYNPVAGAVGHAVAVLLGRDPKHQMDDDLVRLKSTIESGTPPRDAARPLVSSELTTEISPRLVGQ